VRTRFQKTQNRFGQSEDDNPLSIPEIAFLNSFSRTRQITTWGSRIEVAVSDEPTEAYLSHEYHHVIRAVLSDLGATRFALSVRDPPWVTAISIPIRGGYHRPVVKTARMASAP